MKVERTIEGGCVTLSIAGRVDTATVSKLEDPLNECLADAKVLVFDCSELEYVSSVGLRVFLKAQKAMNLQGEMKLIHVNETVMEILDITGFTDILTIE
ncbi:MAG: STAS domain-containing protein [Eggerthellaceae bacterium]|nr:STAS domain-containing protein [Eggerthellaceae bacterium]